MSAPSLYRRYPRLRGGSDLTRTAIGQPLPADVLQKNIGALSVVYSERGSVRITEIELGHVAMKVLLSNMVERANEAAFQDQLRELGYATDQNLVIDWRFADGDLDRLPTLAAEPT